MKYSKFFLFFGTLLFINPLFSQEINQLDANGKRHGVWKKTYDNSAQLRYEGTFDHGKEVGDFKYYCEKCKEKPSAIKTYKPNSALAHVKYVTLKGKVVSEGAMDEKDRDGEWLYYHEKNNVVMMRENYKSGKLDGLKTTYYPNGKMTEEQNFKNGILEGPNNYYGTNGVLLKKLNYKNDQLHGPAKYYDANGTLEIEGFYKNGKKDGVWKYYKNKTLQKEEIYPKPLEKGKN